MTVGARMPVLATGQINPKNVNPPIHSSKNGISSERPSSIAYILDDDEPTRTALASLLKSVGMHTETFDTSRAFLAHIRPPVPSCLVLDVRLRGESGLALQRRLAEEAIRVPIVFVTGYGDIAMSVKAMKAGAVDFLTKPFRDQDMLDAVSRALIEDAKRLVSDKAASSVRRCFDTLTLREQQVMQHVVRGMLNKEIAGELALSEITVKIHRGRMMKKMEARSVAELVRKSNVVADFPFQT
jgi:FixJ family two-component response regulator